MPVCHPVGARPLYDAFLAIFLVEWTGWHKQKHGDFDLLMAMLIKCFDASVRCVPINFDLA